LEKQNSPTVHRGRHVKSNVFFFYILDFENSLNRKAATVCKLNAAESSVFSPHILTPVCEGREKSVGAAAMSWGVTFQNAIFFLILNVSRNVYQTIYRTKIQPVNRPA